MLSQKKLKVKKGNNAWFDTVMRLYFLGFRLGYNKSTNRRTQLLRETPWSAKSLASDTPYQYIYFISDQEFRVGFTDEIFEKNDYEEIFELPCPIWMKLQELIAKYTWPWMPFLFKG